MEPAIERIEVERAQLLTRRLAHREIPESSERLDAAQLIAREFEFQFQLTICNAHGTYCEDLMTV